MEEDEQIRQRVSMRVRVSRGGRHVFYACRLFCRQRGGRSSHHSPQAGRKECNEAMTIDKEDGEQAKGEESGLHIGISRVGWSFAAHCFPGQDPAQYDNSECWLGPR
jgi:hypothetical protein